MNPLFRNALPILTKIEDAGYEAYFVGGAVRDHLLNRPISDVDIASSATPAEIKQIFPHTVDVGIEHGTVLVLYHGCSYEITTFRTETSYKDFRRPDEVQFIRSLNEDLKRRDFTMNAMAMNKDGAIIDPFFGRKAISERKIVTVGRAEDRFTEDALRMMRAIRFVSQLSFSLDDECFKALENMGHLLTHIAVERKCAEFEKLLVGNNRNEALQFLCMTNLDYYLPVLKTYHKRIDRVAQFDNHELSIDEMWTLLVHLIEIESSSLESFLRSWKLPGKKIRDIRQIVHWLCFRLENNWDNQALYAAGKSYMINSERVFNVLQGKNTEADINNLLKRYHSLPIKSKQELNITGTDLMKLLNRPPGPWIKETLTKIEEEILEGRLENEQVKIREWVNLCNLR
ncbi:CCA tRNA nucleotidyltransferase [Bacillus marasmi]|uniref:CCA tRNA nucleotidyltransferase n=1 Tax=Bacillus marasmi TaxID=1926279 RepID=UPI001FE630AE|nr:CCA tRNA nucleotidyltransferase [Bacillus marasmi]